METTTNATTADVAEEELTSASLSGRLKSSLSLVQTRITGVPALARAQWSVIPRQFDELADRFAERVRDTLDLPSKSDLDDLLARVDELDAALAKLTDAKGKKAPAKKTTAKKSTAKKPAAKKAPAKKAGAKKAKGDEAKAKRKAKIKQSASRSTRKKS